MDERWHTLLLLLTRLQKDTMAILLERRKLKIGGKILIALLSSSSKHSKTDTFTKFWSEVVVACPSYFHKNDVIYHRFQPTYVPYILWRENRPFYLYRVKFPSHLIKQRDATIFPLHLHVDGGYVTRELHNKRKWYMTEFLSCIRYINPFLQVFQLILSNKNDHWIPTTAVCTGKSFAGEVETITCSQ